MNGSTGSEQNINLYPNQHTNMNNKDLQLELPNDSNVLSLCIKNLFIGLNKANKSGAFDIQEAYQLRSDLAILSNVVEQINKKVYNIKN
jgi:hypothetical protein